MINIADVKTDDLPNLTAWKQRIEARPAVQKGLNIQGEIGILKAVHVRLPLALLVSVALATLDCDSTKKMVMLTPYECLNCTFINAPYPLS